jgi:hypothetical protein
MSVNIKEAVLLFTLLIGGILGAAAQLPDGYTEVKLAYGSDNYLFGIGGRNDCWIRQDGIYDEAQLKPLLADKECAESVKAMNIDFAKQTLVGWSAGGDCHMSVRLKVFRSEAEKKYLVIINNIYGGCRAGGSRSGWIVLDKIPSDYTLGVKEVRVDRIHGINDDGKDFYFPKQPSNIKPVLIESREIDVKNCLPMDRQSQWILIKDEFLQTALEGKGRECKQHFKDLAIDFNKYTLAGYNVNSGDCHRPLDLAQRVFDDAGEKRYVMEISYSRPSYGSCHVPRWHSVWALVPKLPGDYSFEFAIKATKPPAPKQ